MTFEEILPGLKAKKKIRTNRLGRSRKLRPTFDTIEQNGGGSGSDTLFPSSTSLVKGRFLHVEPNPL